MSTYYFKGLPGHCMKEFSPVRDALDNLSNILNVVEIATFHQNKILPDYTNNFDIAIFTGTCNRALVRKSNGYFTMSLPFQIIDHGDRISFNFDPIQGEVNGLFLSIMRNAITASKDSYISCDNVVLSISETFGLDIPESTMFCDAFFTLLADDHGYFRFDDDVEGENGKIHPRFHFDFYFKNSSSVKIGTEKLVGIECFLSLFDKKSPKMYLK